MVTEV